MGQSNLKIKCEMWSSWGESLGYWLWRAERAYQHRLQYSASKYFRWFLDIKSSFIWEIWSSVWWSCWESEWMWEAAGWDGDWVSCCGGRKCTSEECWSLPKVSTNGVERNHSFAKVYLFFFIVVELKCRKSSSWIMGASATLYEVHEIPTIQEEEERWYILSFIFATLTVAEASSLMT